MHLTISCLGYLLPYFIFSDSSSFTIRFLQVKLQLTSTLAVYSLQQQQVVLEPNMMMTTHTWTLASYVLPNTAHHHRIHKPRSKLTCLCSSQFADVLQ